MANRGVVIGMERGQGERRTRKLETGNRKRTAKAEAKSPIAITVEEIIEERWPRGTTRRRMKRKKRRKTKKLEAKKGGKSNEQTLNEATYNKLWCFDLAMEQALEKC